MCTENYDMVWVVIKLKCLYTYTHQYPNTANRRTRFTIVAVMQRITQLVVFHLLVNPIIKLKLILLALPWNGKGIDKQPLLAT